MKKTIAISALMLAGFAAAAQNTQTVISEAAAALSQAEDVPVKVEKPKYWDNAVTTSISFGQTYLSQWAAGGYNNVTINANLDGRANYTRDKLLGVTRLQMDYGLLYSADKPIFQKTKDRIYFESKWGLQSGIKNLAYSASFDFRTQFDNNYAYGTPKADGETEPTKEDWLNARTLKSGFFSPAYVNLGLGILWTPAPWFSLNVAPLTGGLVVVNQEALRKTYGMQLREESLDASIGANYRSVRFDLGAQIKADASWVINDEFAYTTQLALFYNYLKPKVEPRVTWDNKIVWKLRKWMALTFTTNLIYDPLVLVRDTDGDGVADAKGVQFRQYSEIGFTYTIANKR